MPDGVVNGINSKKVRRIHNNDSGGLNKHLLSFGLKPLPYV